jgi:hypothetical protein
MKALEAFIDHLPAATLTHIGGIVIALVGYLNGDLSVFQALAAVGIVGVGAGQLGVARNGAGRGLKR